MDPVGAPLSNNDVHNQSHRQSILGSFLRGRPRGTSQSQQQGPGLLNLQIDHDPSNGQVFPEHLLNSMPSAQPPSPNPGHRRRPAAAGGGGLQPSFSNASHGFSIAPPATTSVSVHGLSQMLRRRRSANGALNSTQAANNANSPLDNPSSGLLNRAQALLSTSDANAALGRTHRIRLVPHLDSTRSLHFEPISRDVREGDQSLRIGRFTDRSGMGVAALNAQNTNKLAFKSKVVSRAHAEVWCEPGGNFFIKDTKSSSGTFLNHIRLSAPNTDSKPFPIKDGDVLQLGVDYQGGTEEIYKCVKMRIELGREWQAQANAFNTNALKQLKALSVQPATDKPATKGAIVKSGISDCCICLFSVTVHQSLFIAPCSHVFHYKCIRPMLLMHHPGFSCPLCRTFANLEEDVEIDFEDVDTDNADGVGTGTGGSGAEGRSTEAGRSSNSNEREVIDIDGLLSEAAAQANGAGAETEVERDFAPPNWRRRNGMGNSHSEGAMTLRNNNNDGQSLSPPPLRGGGQFEDLLEDADEYLSVGTADEPDGMDDMHPLPALPVPTPSGPLLVPGTSSSNSVLAASATPGGIAIQRPMSVPVPTPMRGMSVDDASDCDVDRLVLGEDDGDDDFSGIGMGMVAMGMGVGVGGEDGNASGSSGEGGPLGVNGMGAGAGEKRKR